jgi:hypothetical protein
MSNDQLVTLKPTWRGTTEFDVTVRRIGNGVKILVTVVQYTTSATSLRDRRAMAVACEAARKSGASSVDCTIIAPTVVTSPNVLLPNGKKAHVKVARTTFAFSAVE